MKSNIDDNEDIGKAKQRQLDRLSEDNDSLVEQINTYSSQLRIITKEKTKTEEDIKAIKDALVKSEKQTSKAKEHEASLMCLKEQKIQMTIKLKMIEQELAAGLLRKKRPRLKKILKPLKMLWSNLKSKHPKPRSIQN